jgi:hypothetical protein
MGWWDGNFESIVAPDGRHENCFYEDVSTPDIRFITNYQRNAK